MKNSQLSKIFSTAVFASSMIALGGCNQGSQERQRYVTIQNIKTHTIRWHFENHCISLLDSEQASLDRIDADTHLRVSEKNEMRSLLVRYMQSSIESKSSGAISEYGCPIIGAEQPINPPMKEVIQKSKSLTISDKERLLKQIEVSGN